MKIRFVPLILKMVTRQRMRTILTVGGVATAMFLFALIQSLQNGVREATEMGADDTTLVVYRENRFCPFTSRLPEDYQRRIEAVSGVDTVTPMMIVVSNCRASLDVVTFRGVRPDHFAATDGSRLRMISGSLDTWQQRTDGALVGRTLAERRGLSTGQRFDANGVTVTVSGIFDSDEAQDVNVAYVDLEFLQRAPGAKGDGIVTQFNVRIDDPSRADEIASDIDATFASAQEPTYTSPEKAFVARAAADALELIGFTWWVAFGCVGAVTALVANAIVLTVQERVRDIAVLQTLGYTGGLVARMIITEGLILGLAGGVFGAFGAAALLAWGDFSLSNEGLSIAAEASVETVAIAIGLSAVLGVVAGLVPAMRAARIEIAASFRAV